jgi:transposase-like protein
MEIRPSPNQEALIRQAVEAGRFERAEDVVKEALGLWEERERPQAKFRETLFTFLRFPDDQWKSIRTTNAIERLHEEFKRRIKTQCMLPCADTACMLFWALMASGQITLRKVDGWKTLHLAPAEQLFDQAA